MLELYGPEAKGNLWPRKTAPKAHRVANCHWVAQGKHVDVLHVPAKRVGVYRGLQTCGSVWACAVCAAKISERRRKEVKAALDAARAQGYKLMFCTYTIRHSAGEDLAYLLEGLLKARAGLVSGRGSAEFREQFGFGGSIRGLEVMHGGNGWHPHMHELMLVRQDVKAADLRAALFPRWAAQVERAGLRGISPLAFDVTDSDAEIAKYLSKWGGDLPVWGPEHELTKQVVKSGREGSRSPADLLWDYTNGDELAGVLWLEYAMAFHGQNQLVWSPGLRAKLGLGPDKTDEEVAAEVEEDAVLLARLTLDDWRKVLRGDHRAEVLDAADSGSPDVLWAVLEGLGIPRRPLPQRGDLDRLLAEVPF